MCGYFENLYTDWFVLVHAQLAICKYLIMMELAYLWVWGIATCSAIHSSCADTSFNPCMWLHYYICRCILNGQCVIAEQQAMRGQWSRTIVDFAMYIYIIYAQARWPMIMRILEDCPSADILCRPCCIKYLPTGNPLVQRLQRGRTLRVDLKTISTNSSVGKGVSHVNWTPG